MAEGPREPIQVYLTAEERERLDGLLAPAARRVAGRSPMPLPDLIRALPRIPPGEADAFAADIESARRESWDPGRDPWAS